MNKPLEIINLNKSYGNLNAVKNISFFLNPGEIFGLLGPNGAGKTTTISIITSLEKADSGEVIVFGKNIVQNAVFVKSRIGIVPQELITQGFFTVQEILHFQAGYYSIKNPDKWIYFILKRLELYEHRKKMAVQLSGGMKRRLLIAKALIHKPKLLLLDEPTAGVDIDLRQTLWDFIKELNQEGMTILLTTHYLEEAEKLCNRIGIIHHGKLIHIDKTRTLIDKLTTKKITLVLSNGEEVKSSKYLWKKEGNNYTFEVPGNMCFSALLQEVGITASHILDVKVLEGTLEKAFRNIIGKADDSNNAF